MHYKNLIDNEKPIRDLNEVYIHHKNLAAYFLRRLPNNTYSDEHLLSVLRLGRAALPASCKDLIIDHGDDMFVDKSLIIGGLK